MAAKGGKLLSYKVYTWLSVYGLEVKEILFVSQVINLSMQDGACHADYQFLADSIFSSESYLRNKLVPKLVKDKIIIKITRSRRHKDLLFNPTLFTEDYVCPEVIAAHGDLIKKSFEFLDKVVHT